jgi:putative peptidoglycan lipid II flippase
MTEEKKSGISSGKATYFLMIMTFISRMLGFVKNKIISVYFGAGPVADVINSTFSFPNQLRRLMAEGALSSAFIPVLSKTLVSDPTKEKASSLFQSILAFQVIVLVPFCVLCMVFARPIVDGILFNFPDSSQIPLAADLFGLFSFYLLLVSLAAALMAVLNCHHRFLLPALTPILLSFAIIGSIVFLNKSMGPYSMVVGVLGGGLIQIVVQILPVKKLGYKITPLIRFNQPEFRLVLKQWGPVLLSSSIFTINSLVAAKFASGLETGSSSALQYGLLFYQLPFGVFFNAISTVMFPRMSREAAVNDLGALRNSIGYGMRFIVVTLIPSTILLSFLAQEIIGVFYLGRTISVETCRVTADILISYSWGMVGSALFTYLQRYFYSRTKPNLPFVVSLIVVAVDIILMVILKDTPLKVSALGHANSAAFLLGSLILLVMARRDLQRIDFRKTIVTIIQLSVASAVVIGAILLYRLLAGFWWAEGLTVMNLAFLILIGTGGCAIYFGFFVLFKIDVVYDVILRRRKKK